MPLEIYDQNAVHSSPVGFVGSFIDIVDYVEDILRRHSSLELLLSAKSPDCDDAASFCSILTDKLQYCQFDTSDSVRYFSNDSFKTMNAKQRFFDAAFNNEPCTGSNCINSCNANSAPKHQLTDAINSNIQNKNVLNNAEATAVRNHMTMTIHIGKLQQQKYCYIVGLANSLIYCSNVHSLNSLKSVCILISLF